MTCLIAGLAVLVGMASGGCSSPSLPHSPYAAEYAEAMQSAKSEYVRNILSKGYITTADLKDAEQHVITCLTNAGVNATYITDEYGIDNLAFTTNNGDSDQLIVKQCDDQWMGQIETLWYYQYVNPNNQDFNELIASCLVRKGLVAAGFTGQDYSDLTEANSTWISVTADPNGNGLTIGPKDTNPTQPGVLPGGVSLGDPRALACQVVPLQ